MPSVSSQGKAHVAAGSYIEVAETSGGSDELIFSGRLVGTYTLDEPAGATDITNSESPQDANGQIQPEFIENKIAQGKTLTVTIFHDPGQTLPLGLLKYIKIRWATRKGETTGAIWDFRALFSNNNSTGAFSSNQRGETTVQMMISGVITKTAPT